MYNTFTCKKYQNIHDTARIETSSYHQLERLAQMIGGRWCVMGEEVLQCKAMWLLTVSLWVRDMAEDTPKLCWVDEWMSRQKR